MPDLVTHACSALFPRAFVRGPHTGTFLLGVVLPDLTGRVPTIALVAFQSTTGLELPKELLYPSQVLHMPIGILLLSVIVSRVFVPEQQRAALAWLIGGGALHLALDVLQDHHGFGYMLGYPLSRETFELGCIGSEATVPWAPVFALVTLGAWGVRWVMDRRRRGDGRQSE